MHRASLTPYRAPWDRFHHDRVRLPDPWRTRSWMYCGRRCCETGWQRHLAIDPRQASAYLGIGRELLCAAGLARISELITERSQIALPQLLTGGLTVDAAFVDGSHRFHEVFVDLYFLRSLVSPGGLIVLDDHWWPSVATAARYYQRDLGWELLDRLPGGSTGPDSGQPRVRVLRLPAVPAEPAFDTLKPF